MVSLPQMQQYGAASACTLGASTYYVIGLFRCIMADLGVRGFR